jgi:hypothetical protein
MMCKREECDVPTDMKYRGTCEKESLKLGFTSATFRFESYAGRRGFKSSEDWKKHLGADSSKVFEPLWRIALRGGGIPPS